MFNKQILSRIIFFFEIKQRNVFCFLIFIKMMKPKHHYLQEFEQSSPLCHLLSGHFFFCKKRKKIHYTEKKITTIELKYACINIELIFKRMY